MWVFLKAATALFASTSSFGPPSEQGISKDQKINSLVTEHSHDNLLSSSDAWSLGLAKAISLVGNMTIEEKVGNSPSYSWAKVERDLGTSGPRYTDFVTQFPSAFTVAASFDRELIEERARRIGREFRGKGINVELGPVTGGPLGRSPYAGRNWEAFSPDPYLSSTLSFLSVRGMQESGLITCAKHYFLYEQEPVCYGPIDDQGGRTGCVQVSAEVDDKTMRELYLPSFVETVRAGTGSIMCSYNKINGTQTCENDNALNKILKDELNFQGFDFGATHSTAPSALAGMDMELAQVVFYGKHLLKAVRKGDVPEKRLNEMAVRILTPYFAARQDTSYPSINYQSNNLADAIEADGRIYRNKHVDNRGDNPEFARKVAAESTVLLKNSGILPFKGIRRISVFGSDAAYPDTLSGCGGNLFCLVASERRYWNGTVTIGGGSGAAYSDYVAAPLEAISLKARSLGMRVDHYLHDDPAHYGAINTVASQCEVCLVFVSLFLVEGWDRDDLRLDKGGEELVKVVEKGCAGQVVVVLHIGGQVIMEDWLPFTMGRSASDWPSGNIIRKESMIDDVYPRAVFSEGLAIDYKWFDIWGIKPRYEFGFGLSYTTFEFAGLDIRQEYRPDSESVHMTKEQYEGNSSLYDTIYVARVNVTNTGKISGAEVAQLYVSYPMTEVEQPPRQLRGYSKIYLGPSQTETVDFPLRKKDLAVWDVVRQVWTIPEGEFVFWSGNSSRLLPLKVELYLNGTY
ncbi:glycoside hydrolase superfamily [Naematelia encephala]|uniref:Probable beta-glucosidase G n=1 Tax=Naematelia encephala TaxID=71784 RepID=A0A1Y2BMD2_9TREE|nr:glycoside hydrolase superfamily [Naematelia encephala]